MRTRHLAVSLLATLAVAASACGSDDSTSAPVADETLPPITDPPDGGPTTDATDGDTTTDPPTTESPTTEPSAEDEPSETDDPPTDPSGEDDAAPAEGDTVLWYEVAGGFLPRELAFQSPPSLIVTADGRAITPAVTTAQFPGPLVVPHIERSITDVGIDALLAAADEAGLLADVAYAENPNIADAPTTILRITTADEAYEHSAYALGMAAGGPLGDGGAADDDASAALQGFLDSLADLESLVGADELGPEVEYEPTAYVLVAFEAEPFGDASAGPAVVEWAAPSVVLADLARPGNCVIVDAVEVDALFAGATTQTVFDDSGTTYQVLVRPDYPGGAGCPEGG